VGERWVGRKPTDECVRVAVCITTFHRREGLERTLRSLEKLTFRSEPAPEVRVLVVDNAPEEGIAVEVASRMPSYRFPLNCISEPRTGLVYARNTGVKIALSFRATWIAFLDDDETVHPAWLDELLSAARFCRADIVAGPVVPLFEVAPPRWILRGRFFDRPRPATGTNLRTAPGGNVLVSAEALAGLTAPFDLDFARIHGEDTLLFAQLASRGARIVWADEAVVDDWVPAGRATVRWLLRRNLVGGNNWVLIERKLSPGRFRGVLRAGKGIGHIIWGAGLLAPAGLAGHHAVVQCATKIWLGAGMLLALCGVRIESYGNVSQTDSPRGRASESQEQPIQETRNLVRGRP
jgi:glycosyltransferase involved in cell wall biosynthesis